MLTTEIIRKRPEQLIQLNDQLGMHLNGPGFEGESNNTYVTNKLNEKVLPTRGKVCYTPSSEQKRKYNVPFRTGYHIYNYEGANSVAIFIKPTQLTGYNNLKQYVQDFTSGPKLTLTLPNASKLRTLKLNDPINPRTEVNNPDFTRYHNIYIFALLENKLITHGSYLQLGRFYIEHIKGETFTFVPINDLAHTRTDSNVHPIDTSSHDRSPYDIIINSVPSVPSKPKSLEVEHKPYKSKSVPPVPSKRKSLEVEHKPYKSKSSKVEPSQPKPKSIPTKEMIEYFQSFTSQPGPSQPGPSQPRPSQPGPSQPRPSQTGPSQPRPSQTEPYRIPRLITDAEQKARQQRLEEEMIKHAKHQYKDKTEHELERSDEQLKKDYGFDINQYDTMQPMHYQKDYLTPSEHRLKKAYSFDINQYDTMVGSYITPEQLRNQVYDRVNNYCSDTKDATMIIDKLKRYTDTQILDFSQNFDVKFGEIMNIISEEKSEQEELNLMMMDLDNPLAEMFGN